MTNAALLPQRRLVARPFEFHGYVVEAVLRRGDARKARVLLAHRDGKRVVIKDLSPMRPLLRAIFGRRMLRREARALSALKGFAHAPRLIEHIAQDALVIEFHNAMYLRKNFGPDRLPSILRSFKKAVAALHERGVVHLDLRQRKNVLVTRRNRVVLIDYESALVFGRGRFGRFMVRMLGSIDTQAVLKWKLKYVPHLVSREGHRSARRWRNLRRLWFPRGLVKGVRRMFRRAG